MSWSILGITYKKSRIERNYDISDKIKIGALGELSNCTNCKGEITLTSSCEEKVKIYRSILLYYNYIVVISYSNKGTATLFAEPTYLSLNRFSADNIRPPMYP